MMSFFFLKRVDAIICWENDTHFYALGSCKLFINTLSLCSKYTEPWRRRKSSLSSSEGSLNPGLGSSSVNTQRRSLGQMSTDKFFNNHPANEQKGPYMGAQGRKGKIWIPLIEAKLFHSYLFILCPKGNMRLCFAADSFNVWRIH